MSHELWRLRESLYNTPLYSDQETLKSVVSYLTARNKGDVDIKADAFDVDEDHQRYAYYEDSALAFMSITGPLTYKPVTFMGMQCGGQSYTALKEDVADAISKGVKTIVFDVDSGGGYAFGMIDSAQYIRKLADDNGVEILAYVDGRCASAAYGLTCIADKIIGHPDSSFGSVGVIIELLNDSEALKKEGYERSFIYAGGEKQPFADDGSFREGFIKSLQESVDDSYEKFTSHVSTMTGVPLDVVKGTEAAMFPVEAAIKLGLAHDVMSPEAFYEYLASKAKSNTEVNNMMSVKDRIFKFNKTDEGKPTMNVEELQAQLATAQEQVASMPALTSQLATLTASLQEKEVAMQALAAKLEGIEVAKAEAAVAQRKTTLSALLPEDKVEESMSMYAGLDDATFSFVTSQLQATKDALAASGLMAEVGGEGVEQEAKAPEAGSPEDIVAKGKAAAQKLRK